MKKPVSTFILFTSFFCIIIAVAAKSCFWSAGEGWTINVINEINTKDKIQVHCKSKNDDIGMKAIGFHEHVDWHFCEDVWGDTLYFCHVYKGSQEQVFDVFNHGMRHMCTEQDKSKDFFRCSWAIQPDGIHFIDRRGGGEKNIKMYDWKNGRAKL